MQKPTQELFKLVNESGYPFQEGLREEVQRTTEAHGWTVIAGEHRWRDKNGNEGFIDLVLGSGNLRMVVEVKKSKEATWIFLASKLSRKSTSEARCLGISQSDEPCWCDKEVVLQSSEANFCVIRGQDRDKPLLERICGILLRSTEALAEEEIRLEISRRYIYFPAVVTNARMYTCDYDPGSVDLNTGELPEGGGEFKQVDFIRFRKELSTIWPLENMRVNNLKRSSQANERTIFVINGAKLVDILKGWECW